LIKISPVLLKLLFL